MPDPSATRGTPPTPASGPATREARTASNDPARYTTSPAALDDGPVTGEQLDAGRLAGQVTPVTGERTDGRAADDDDERIRPRRRKSRNVLIWLALGWIGLVAVLAITASWLPIADPNDQALTDMLIPPFTDSRYLLGTDGLGRDILARLVFGARVSLTISVAAVTIGLLIGGSLGMVAGFFRGRVEAVLMAVVNVILAFPGLVLLLGLVAFVGQSLSAITLVVGFLSIPIYARVSRATTLAVAQREYVMAARAMGATNTRILLREILPNVILPVAAFGFIALGTIVVLEGTLAFLGLSVPPPDSTWGSMIAEGKRHLTRTTHLAMLPSIAMFLTVLAINFVGDALRERFDVKESSL